MPRSGRGAGGKPPKGPKEPKAQVRGIHKRAEPGPHGELVLDAITHDKQIVGTARVRPKHTDKAARARLQRVLDKEDPVPPAPRLVAD